MTSTENTATIIVTVGHSGSGVRHYGYGFADSKQLVTRCGAERRHIGTGAVRVVPGATEATCRACNPAATGKPAKAAAPAVDEAARKAGRIRAAGRYVADYADLIATVTERGEDTTELEATLAGHVARLTAALAS